MKNLELKKLTNKELIESAFKNIEEETGFHIIDKVFSDCYFIFADEDDSICHFRIREIPGFLFAFWNTCRFDNIKKQSKEKGIGNTWADHLNISPKSELVFFTQYERELDKFKPSRSGFVTGIYRECYPLIDEEDSSKEEWNMWDLINILKYMKKHRLKSVFYVSMQITNIWDEISSIQALKIYLIDSFNYFKYSMKKKLKLKKHKRVAKQLVRKLHFLNAYILDRGPYVSPRIDIFIRRKSNIKIEEFEHDYELVNKFDDKWFNEISINSMDMNITNKLTEDDINEDNRLKSLFYENIQSIEEGTYLDNDEGESIVYINVDKQN